MYVYLGGCQNYGPFLGPYYNELTYYLGYPKRDHNFDNHPFVSGTDQKHGHKCGLAKETSYYQRNHLMWFPILLRCQAHGGDTAEAKNKIEMERKVQQG